MTNELYWVTYETSNGEAHATDYLPSWSDALKTAKDMSERFFEVAAILFTYNECVYGGDVQKRVRFENGKVER